MATNHTIELKCTNCGLRFSSPSLNKLELGLRAITGHECPFCDTKHHAAREYIVVPTVNGHMLQKWDIIAQAWLDTDLLFDTKQAAIDALKTATHHPRSREKILK